jgi:hypothetical protein
LLVALLAHLSEADIARYVAGFQSSETDRHVRVCPSCAQRLAAASQQVFRWERRGLLRRLVRVDPAQMVDELLAELEEHQTPHAA